MLSRLMLPIVLQLGGVVIVLAEALLPSGGLLTVAALGLFGWSLYLVFSGLPAAVGVGFVVLDMLMVPGLLLIGVKLIAKSPYALRKNLSSRDGVVVQDEALEALVGAEGTVISDCRPSGRALINGRKYDVVSNGDYLEDGAAVTVHEVNGNRIVVEAKHQTEADPE